MINYYSNLTKKSYKTEAEAMSAEKAYLDEQAKKEAEAKKLKEDRKNRAHEVDAAYDTMVKAQKEYVELLKAFTKDYGYYHKTIKSDSDSQNYLESVFDMLGIF